MSYLIECKNLTAGYEGMPVVKAFNLAGKSHKATSEDFWKLTEAQIKFEKRSPADRRTEGLPRYCA